MTCAAIAHVSGEFHLSIPFLTSLTYMKKIYKMIKAIDAKKKPARVNLRGLGK